MASDYLLELDGIKGESKDNKHPATIEVQSFSWGASNPTSIGSSGLSAGKVSFSSINLLFDTEKAAPTLLTYCATGKHIKTVKLFGRKGGADDPQDYYILTLDDCMIESLQQSASNGGGIPSCSMSLAFAKIKWEYLPQKDDQTLDAAVTSTYDLKAAKK